MKKNIIIFLILTIFVFSAGAEMGMSFGMKGGISLNHMWGDDWDDVLNSDDGDNKMRLGFSVGGFAALNIMKNFAIQPEVYMSLIGGGYDYVAGGDTYENTQRLWVVEIPILAKLTLPAGNFKGSVFAGGDIMIKVFDYTSKTDEEEETINDIYFKRPYFGLVGGIELGIPMSNKLTFLVDIRYVWMLSDIFDEDFTNNTEFKSNSLKFMIGIATGM
jgi:hypothetical protein